MCSWHRLLIVAKVPKELQTSYIITDDLTKATQQHEWVVLEKNQMEANLFRTRGRYLLLKFATASKGKHELPTIKYVRVYFAREKYIEYLPAVYQNESYDGDFIKRYLSIFEEFNQKIEHRIQSISAIFSAHQTPSDFLPWLSTWVGSIKDERLPEDKWRIFLSRAAVLYRRRGTKAK